MDRRGFLSSAAAFATLAGFSARAAEPSSIARARIPWNARFAPPLSLRGLDTPMFADTLGTLDPVVHIDFIADLGFAGVEDNRLKARSVADQIRVGEALVRRGLEMGAFLNNLESSRTPILGSSDPSQFEQLKRELLSSIETAKRVNGRSLNTVSQRNPRIPLSFELQQMVENLKRLAPIAEKAGVVILIEPINERSSPGMLIHKAADAAFVVRAVDSPAVRVLFDCWHVQVMEGDLIANYDRCKELIGLVQIADNPGRGEPGTGEINYANVIRHINASGYKGLIEMEHEVSRPGAAGEAAMIEAYKELNAKLI